MAINWKEWGRKEHYSLEVVFLPNNKYQRGARAERELLGIFHENGWAVIRSSGSGVNALSPDVVAIKNKISVACECKAWDRGSLSLDPEQFEKILEWQRFSGSHAFVAWRRDGKLWYFIKPEEFTKNEKSYTVTLKTTVAINRVLDDILKLTEYVPTPPKTQPEADLGTVSVGI